MQNWSAIWSDKQWVPNISSLYATKCSVLSLYFMWRKETRGKFKTWFCILKCKLCAKPCTYTTMKLIQLYASILWFFFSSPVYTIHIFLVHLQASTFACVIKRVHLQANEQNIYPLYLYKSNIDRPVHKFKNIFTFYRWKYQEHNVLYFMKAKR